MPKHTEIRMKSLPLEEKAVEETVQVPNKKLGIALLFLACLPAVPGILLWILCTPDAFIEKYIVTVSAFVLFGFAFKEVNSTVRMIM